MPKIKTPSEPQQATAPFAHRVLEWFDQHGRKNLPWQQDITPYRVWISEIMLQQTQVATVIPYFETFMRHFPDVDSLAAADTDEVLHLWTGLGYYARARNLHKAAKQVSSEHNGQFPDTVDALAELSGIGRSTAAAIVSIAFQQPATILDGNVKRVLARHQCVEGWPGSTRTQNALWDIAEAYTPNHRSRDYTQVMMDLGATLCTRSKPLCEFCPIKSDCLAYANHCQTDFPHKKPKKALPEKFTHMLIVVNDSNEIYLEQRPNSGIWGGLYSFPECKAPTAEITEIINDAPPALRPALDSINHIREIEQWSQFKHTFSHYHLMITPVIIRLNHTPLTIADGNQHTWFNTKAPGKLGLAAPVKKLLSKLA
ncbi:A/G-specific adenine glycosylase [Gammaproteobacteria bacterium 45_16_T64]|nr:A/G-specific adenine glycosylase [Gammaproteobacteria bacterium 45_16_T64]